MSAVVAELNAYKNKKTGLEVADIGDMMCEAFIIKTVLFNRDLQALKKIFSDVSDEYFSNPDYRIIFNLAYESYKKNGYCDYMEVMEHAKNSVPYNVLNDIANLVLPIESMYVDKNISKLRELYCKRKIYDYIYDACQQVRHSSIQSIAVTISRIQKEIQKLSLVEKKEEDMTIRDVIVETINEMQNSSASVLTGFTSFDELTTGFRNGDYIVIAGRPSTGKTAFSLCCAYYQSVVLNIPVVYYSSEMSVNGIGERILSMLTGKNIKEIRTHGVDESDVDLVASNIKHAPLYFVFNNKVFDDIEKDIYEKKEKYDIKVAYIDYLQLLTPKGKQMFDRNKEISEMSMRIKHISQDLNIPVVVVAQLNRAVEKEKRKPRLSDIRDCGCVEADADMVCFLSKDEELMITELIIAKGRNVGTGTVQLKWMVDNMKFAEIA